MNHDLRPGAEPVKGYFLIERLGKGGFGEVWKATGPGGFQVALKFVALDENSGPVELRALEVIKDIRHPHLLGTFGSWQQNGQLIIAMELAERTLLDRFRESAGQGFPGIPAPEIFEHFRDAAQALDYLNEPRHPTGESGPQGIQHRDVKPQNLLLVGGSVKVADFGLARVLEHSTTGHTGSLTPSYAAPEFFDQKTSSHSDQYSLAITYCHLRGGRLPFEGNVAAVMHGHMHREPDLSMIPEAERSAVVRALAKSPRDRWPSCRTFVQAVMAAGGMEAPPTVAPSDSSWKLTTFPDEPSGSPGHEPDPISELAHAAPRSRNRSARKLAAWALAAAVLLLATILLFRRDKPADVVASSVPDKGRPDAESRRFEARPEGESAKAAPPITAKLGSSESTKPASPVVPDSAPREKNAPVVRAIVDRGLSYVWAVDAENAFAEFHEAIRLEPGNAEAHAGLAFAYEIGAGWINVKVRGLAEADEAIRLDPQSALAHAARCVSLLKTRISNNASMAIAECDEALRLDPNLALIHEIKARTYLFRFSNQSHLLGDLDLAIDECRIAIRLDPKLTKAYALQAGAQKEKGLLDEAMTSSNTALRLNPRFADALRVRALVWQAKGNHSMAITDFARAIEINPNFIGAYLGRAQSYDALGNRAQAQKDRDEAARLRRERENEQ